jgi:hypothetical protein
MKKRYTPNRTFIYFSYFISPETLAICERRTYKSNKSLTAVDIILFFIIFGFQDNFYIIFSFTSQTIRLLVCCALHKVKYFFLHFFFIHIFLVSDGEIRSLSSQFLCLIFSSPYSILVAHH